jgi:hypothetical protein
MSDERRNRFRLQYRLRSLQILVASAAALFFVIRPSSGPGPLVIGVVGTILGRSIARRHYPDRVVAGMLGASLGFALFVIRSGWPDVSWQALDLTFPLAMCGLFGTLFGISGELVSRSVQRRRVCRKRTMRLAYRQPALG